MFQKIYQCVQSIQLLYAVKTQNNIFYNVICNYSQIAAPEERGRESSRLHTLKNK